MSIFSVPPMMWVPAQQISAVRGAPKAKLTCFVEAHPEALTFWEKDRRMIQQGGRFRMSSHRGTPSYKVNQRKLQQQFCWIEPCSTAVLESETLGQQFNKTEHHFCGVFC